MSDTSNGNGITIRAERDDEADHAAIRAVVAAAFNSPIEARLVDDIRASEHFVPEWSLVAEVDGRVVGHVLVGYCEVVDGDTRRRVPNLAPLAVAPEYHGRGIGSALVRAVTALVDERGEPLVILEGAPGYYGRFGFEHSVPLGIHINLPDWAPAEAAQVLRLRYYDPAVRGLVVYPPAFDVIEEHHDE